MVATSAALPEELARGDRPVATPGPAERRAARADTPAAAAAVAKLAPLATLGRADSRELVAWAASGRRPRAVGSVATAPF